MYMFTFLYLTSGVISDVIERDYDEVESVKHFHHVCKIPAFLTCLSSAFFVFFAK